MKNDTISDFLVRIKNAYLARHKTVEVRFTKILFAIGKILAKEGFIEDVKLKTDKEKKILIATLAYPNRKPALTHIERISKPGLRVYTRRSQIPRFFGGLGIVILSTPKGLMNAKEAKKKGFGGEVICKVW